MSAIDWRQSARCQDFDSEIFFPISHGAEREEQVRVAKAICGRCPVQSACLTWALEQGEPFGIWGGLDEAERRRMGAKRRTTNKPPPARLKCRNGHDLTDPDAIYLNARGERCCVTCKLNRHAAALTTAGAS